MWWHSRSIFRSIISNNGFARQASCGVKGLWQKCEIMLRHIGATFLNVRSHSKNTCVSTHSTTSARNQVVNQNELSCVVSFTKGCEIR